MLYWSVMYKIFLKTRARPAASSRLRRTCYIYIVPRSRATRARPLHIYFTHIYFTHHDAPRVVSRFVKDARAREDARGPLDARDERADVQLVCGDAAAAECASRMAGADVLIHEACAPGLLSPRRHFLIIVCSFVRLAICALSSTPRFGMFVSRSHRAARVSPRALVSAARLSAVATRGRPAP